MRQPNILLFMPDQPRGGWAAPPCRTTPIATTGSALARYL